MYNYMNNCNCKIIYVEVKILFLFFQECVKLVKIDRKSGKVAKIRIEDDGFYMEVVEVNIYFSLYFINVLVICIRINRIELLDFIYIFVYICYIQG